MSNQEEASTDELDNANIVIESRRHWLGLPLTPRVQGSFADIRNALPHFGRQPFAMASLNADDMGVNDFLDMIYRMGVRPGEKSIPVGVVSKNYRLVDHHHVLGTVEQALLTNSIDPARLQLAGQWTIHGERAHFSILFPAEERFVHKVTTKNRECDFVWRSSILLREAGALWPLPAGFASFARMVSSSAPR